MRMRQTIGLSLALLIVSAACIAKEARPAHDQSATSIKSKHAEADATGASSSGKQRRAQGKVVAHSQPGHRASARRVAARLPPPDQYIGPLRVIGRREVGTAAWYGGRHLGRRTASGERLDAVHATAAHRSLPLYSLVRVTNLANGRSVIARITDRGPVSRSLLIDVSPSAAATLDMVRVGVATVAIEPVAATPSRPR